MHEEIKREWLRRFLERLNRYDEVERCVMRYGDGHKIGIVAGADFARFRNVRNRKILGKLRWNFEHKRGQSAFAGHFRTIDMPVSARCHMNGNFEGLAGFRWLLGIELHREDGRVHSKLFREVRLVELGVGGLGAKERAQCDREE